MSLVSSVNNTGFDIKFILRGRLFIYIMNNRGSGIGPWGIPCFILPQSEKNFKLYEVILFQLCVFDH